MSSRAAASSDSTVTVPPTRTDPITFASSMTGIGHRFPSASTTSSCAGSGSAAAGAAPSRSRTDATTPGSTARKRSTSAESVPAGSETRTFPSLRTPIARSTWLGVSVELVHDEPDETEKPSRSSSDSSVSPSTYRQEKVTRWGRRRTGSPTTSTSGTSSGTRARIRSTSSRSRAPSAAASARTARSEAAAATIAGRFSKPGARPDSRSSEGPCGANRTPLRTASRPTPAGPPHLCALAASSDQPSGTGPQPSDWAASTSSGTPAARQASATSATGCSVPTSWLADWRQARAVPSPSSAAKAAGSTAPVRPTGTSVTVPPAAACASPACSTEECSTAETTSRPPTRRRPASAPDTPECTARVPEGVKTSSSGRQPTASAAASRAASSSSRARRPSR